MKGSSRVLLGAGLVALLVLVPWFTTEGDAQTSGTVEARMTVSPLQGPVETVFRADASPSRGTLLNGTDRSPIVKYEWDWNGTGEYEEGTVRSRHQYDEDGSYQVRVRVTDATGATGVATRTVSVGEPQTGFRWEVVFDNAPLFWKGAQITFLVSSVAILAGLPLGVFIGLARISKIGPLRWLSAGYIEFLRGTPLIVQIFIVVFALPEIGIKFSALTGGIVALTINSSAYQAEIIRSGIQAIPSGQMEAAVAMGLTYPQAMRFVILPQALRLVIPPLTNEFIILIKDSSLVSLIGVLELLGYARVIGNRTFRLFEPFLAVALIYFIITYSLSLFLQWMERRLAIPGLGVSNGGQH